LTLPGAAVILRFTVHLRRFRDSVVCLALVLLVSACRRAETVYDLAENLGKASVAPASPAPRRIDDTIVMPAGTRLSFLAEASPRCSLRFGAIETAPGSAVRVLIDDARGSLSEGEWTASRSRNVEIPLAVRRPGLIEIRILGRMLSQTAESDAIRLVRPRIECPVQDLASGHAEAVAPEQRRPNVLIYLVDTLRADHLGVYGYGRATSPNVDAFARDSVVFRNAIAQSGWTKTATVSVLTGLGPFRHGTLDRDDALPPSIPTLPVMLAGAGYARFGAVANVNVSREFGFSRGFDEYVNLAGLTGAPDADAASVVQSFMDWLDRRKSSGPFFAYLHTMDPHDPYAAPRPYAKKFSSADLTGLTVPSESRIDALIRERPELTYESVKADLIAKYDAEIAYNDAMFGHAIAELKRRGLYDSTLIVFVSDHGEEFREHTHWGHGHSLYHELLHVPLIVKFPRSRHAGTVVDANVQQVDIAPTVLEAAGVSAPLKLDGLPLMTVSESPERRILSYLRMDVHDVMSAVYGDREYILWRASSGSPAEELIPFGPVTERVQFAEAALWSRELKRTLLLAHQESRNIRAPQVPIEGELAARLRAIGYLR